MRRIGMFVVVALALGAGSCGGDGGDSGAGASGVEKSKRWSELTNDERGALCDWGSEAFGGYGKMMDCGASSAESQQACIDSVPATCNATVGEMETCLKQFVCPTPLDGLNCLLAACA